MKKKLNERAFTTQLVKILRSKGCFTHKVSERYASGFPDLIVIKNGSVFFIEVKVGNNKPTKLQEWHMEEIRKHKGDSFLVTQKTPEIIEVSESEGLLLTYTLEEWMEKYL